MVSLNSRIASCMNEHAVYAYKLLEELVLIQSGSRNKTGVDRMGKRIMQEMIPMGFSCEVSPGHDLGDTLIFRSPSCAKAPAGRQTLILGHMDTVFPADTPFNFYREGDGCCYGPGTVDMKGGLVVGILALKALMQAGLLDALPICFIFNADEEIGSPSSGHVIVEEAKKSEVGFVLEGGGLSNEIVTGRKGILSMRLNIKGEAGHAAFAGKNKASAILELARKTIALEGLNQRERGISANVGTVTGGIGPNVVAEFATASLDFRFLTAQDGDAIKKRVEAIVGEQTTPNTRASLEVLTYRLPMPQTPCNKKLFYHIQKIGQALGLSLDDELRQGVSDANLIALAGIPVVDGLGPIGSKDHSENEYIVKQSLISQALLFAHILASRFKG